MCDLCDTQSMELFHSLLDDDVLIPVIAITAGCATAMVGMVSAGITKVAVARSRERTRREMAAYVAEGSISPDHAVAMLNMDAKPGEPLI